MEKAQFRFEAEEEIQSWGKWNGWVLCSTNPGRFKTLSLRLASGGNYLVMLAIKSAFSRKEGKTSIVFDEVDTGVSGRVAQAIAQKIHKPVWWVLAISHLPQVIAIADYQFFIRED